MSDLTEQISNYRTMLQEMAERMQASYDQTIITLSGGGLGLSLTFYKNIVPEHPTCKCLLVQAWIIWAISIVTILISFNTSQYALRKAIDQLDDGSIHNKPAGGWMNSATAILGIVGGVCFILGIILLASFIVINFR
jgi:hypothetical protein